jgi:acetyl esterase/lipase
LPRHVDLIKTRLAPEDPYPAAVVDVWEALLWSISEGAVALKLDIQQYALAGASAGANLAAVMAQRLLSRPEVRSQIGIKLQLLVVPVTDNTATVDNNPTWKAYEFTPALSAAKMMWYRRHYLPNPKTWTEPEASPLLLSAKQFVGLPPAQILVGELDILRHDGEEYARKLRAAGVDVKLEIMPGMPHRECHSRHPKTIANIAAAFMAMDAVLDQGQRAITIVCESLRAALHPEIAERLRPAPTYTTGNIIWTAFGLGVLAIGIQKLFVRTVSASSNTY